MPLITYLAEDNETIAKNLIETLQEICPVQVTGLGVTQAEATHWLHLHGGFWDLAIVDLFLKEGSGLGVLAGCRDRQPHQKVVVLTNYATPEIRSRALELCADAVFDKSSELEQLFAYCSEQTAHAQTGAFDSSAGSPDVLATPESPSGKVTGAAPTDSPLNFPPGQTGWKH